LYFTYRFCIQADRPRPPDGHPGRSTQTPQTGPRQRSTPLTHATANPRHRQPTMCVSWPIDCILPFSLADDTHSRSRFLLCMNRVSVIATHAAANSRRRRQHTLLAAGSKRLQLLHSINEARTPRFVRFVYPVLYQWRSLPSLLYKFPVLSRNFCW